MPKVEGRYLSPNRSLAGPLLVINNNENLILLCHFASIIVCFAIYYPRYVLVNMRSSDLEVKALVLWKIILPL